MILQPQSADGKPGASPEDMSLGHDALIHKGLEAALELPAYDPEAMYKASDLAIMAAQDEWLRSPEIAPHLTEEIVQAGVDQVRLAERTCRRVIESLGDRFGQASLDVSAVLAEYGVPSAREPSPAVDNSGARPRDRSEPFDWGTVYKDLYSIEPIADRSGPLWPGLENWIQNPTIAPAAIDSPDKKVRSRAKAKLRHFTRAQQTERTHAGTACVTGIVLDFDGAPEDRVRAELAALGYACWLFPSPSHFRQEQRPGAPWKVRAVVIPPYARPCSVEEHKRVYQSWVLKCCPSADKALARAAQPIVGPVVSEKNRPRWWCERIEGASDPIDVDAILAEHPVRPRRRTTSIPTEAKDLPPIGERLEAARRWIKSEESAPVGNTGMMLAALELWDLGVPADECFDLIVEAGWDRDAPNEEGVIEAWKHDELRSEIHRWHAGAKYEFGNKVLVLRPQAGGAGIEAARAEFEEKWDAAPRGALVGAAGPYGVGKSHQARVRFKSWRRGIWETPLCTLTKAAARDLPDAVHYKADDAKSANHIITSAKTADKFGFDWDGVIRDEILATERQIHSKLHYDPRKAMEGFIKRLQAAECICLDADLDRETLERYGRYAGRDVHFFEVSAKAGLERSIIEVVPKKAWAAFFRAIRRAGDRLVFLTDSIKAADIAEHAARQAGRRPLKVSGKSHPDLGDADSWDVLIGTHAMALGESIDVPVDECVVLRTQRRTTPRVIMQMLARCRDLKNTTVLVGCPEWEELFPANRPTTVDGARALIEEQTEAALEASRQEAPDHDELDEIVLDSKAHMLAADNLGWCCPSLMEHCARRGWGWKTDRTKLSKKDPDYAAATEAEKGEEKAYDARVRGAARITPEQATKLRNAMELTQEEQAQLDRHELESFLGSTELFEELGDEIAKNRSGRFVSELKAAAEVRNKAFAVGLDELRGARNPSGRELRASADRGLFYALTGQLPGEALKVELEAGEAAKSVFAWWTKYGSLVQRRVPGWSPPKRADWKNPKLTKADIEAAMKWLRTRVQRYGMRFSCRQGEVVLWWPEKTKQWLAAYLKKKKIEFTVDRMLLHIPASSRVAATARAGGVANAAKARRVHPRKLAVPGRKGGRKPKVTLEQAQAAAAKFPTLKRAAEDLGISERTLRRTLNRRISLA